MSEAEAEVERMYFGLLVFLISNTYSYDIILFSC